MYRNILPYSSRIDQSGIQGHHDNVGNAYINATRRRMHYPLSRAIQSGARRMRSAVRRASAARQARPSMSWWD